MNRELRAVVLVAVWTVCLLTTLAGLHGAGASYAPAPGDGLGAWLAASDAATVVFAALRLAALGTGWYLLVATVLGIGLDVLGFARAAAVVTKVSPRVVRHLVHATAGAALAVGPVTPAVALNSVAPSATVADPAPNDGADTITMRRIDDQPAPAEITMRKLDRDAPVATEERSRRWTLTPGQHLWLVAREVLTAAAGTPPTDGQIDAYWRRLIEANRHRLPHPGNPDLVFPGQVLDLPDLPIPGV